MGFLISVRINYRICHKETNIGVKASFLSLLSRVEADYYFFCDQDDFWYDNKIEKTLEYASKKVPLLIHGNMDLINDNDEILIRRLKKTNLYTDFNSLMKKNNITGCTMMVNNELKKKCWLLDDKKIVMHDWWIGLYAGYYGKVIYIHNPIMAYRKHSNNVMGTEYKITKKVAKLLPVEIQNMKIAKVQLAFFEARENTNDIAIDNYLNQSNFGIKRLKKSISIAKQEKSFIKKIISFIVNLF